jgi:hypothetical protein
MPRCFAYLNPMFQPAMRLLAGITQSNPAIVTTTFNHLYVNGTKVRLDVPIACGMPQINGLTGSILILSPTSFSIDIDSTQFYPFAIPIAPNPHTNICAMVVPIGEDSNTLLAAVQNTLPH